MTKSGKVYEITDRQNQVIMEQSTNGQTPGIWIGSDYLNFYEIKSVTDIERPVVYTTRDITGDEVNMTWEEMKRLPGSGMNKLINRAPNKVLEGMIKGLKKTIAKVEATGKIKPATLELLKKMELRLKEKQLA